MIDFSSAIRSGLNAADLVKRQDAEISEIIESLTRSVEVETNNTVTLKLESRVVAGDGILQGVAFILGQNKYKALVVRTNKQTPIRTIEVAGWSQPKAGYPCKLMVAKDEFICADKNSLAGVLSRIFSMPEVGAAIKSLATIVVPASKVVVSARTSISENLVVKGVNSRVVERPFVGKTIRNVEVKKIEKAVAGSKLKGGATASVQKKATQSKSTVGGAVKVRAKPKG